MKRRTEGLSDADEKSTATDLKSHCPWGCFR